MAQVLSKMTSLITNLGLAANNYTSAFILWNWAYAYLLTSPRTLTIRAGLDHNENPRFDLAKYGERAVTEGKLTRKRLQQIQRAQSAHQNSIESFALFASTMVLMNVAKLDAETINLIGALYSIFRVSYVKAYYYIEDRHLSILRSIVWHCGNFSCFYGIW
ncbi:conserved hypothetical protein [Talaromyces stipitatus ATCC 10500]|uniref:Uncharacterized protein n=1 Tax=Talaromyces stipitatus (strain ATCC 10500 / CBS 375.48 / QM 6759 / NRRL 1006) TaxID=441959 RepID=B8MEM0_TALSN|nr:uncharacterized protein TSTA_019650 [Talaromyces stipitatus ATCC 10500]EED16903.1 conserved hypothetical protein [Talaromyces stipitatus ATCC 10500]